MPVPPGFALAAGSGESLRFGGAEFLLKASAETTGGAFSILEEIAPLDTPSHVHEHQDELFVVLEGEHEFTVGEEVFAVVPGRSCSRREAFRTRTGASSHAPGGS